MIATQDKLASKAAEAAQNENQRTDCWVAPPQHILHLLPWHVRLAGQLDFSVILNPSEIAT